MVLWAKGRGFKPLLQQFFLKILKIINNDKIKITLNKKEINEEIIKKYKDLLGDKGYKEYYFDINDK